METLEAFRMAVMHTESKEMVFDWHKAARIIKDRPNETASAGLRGDWEYTGGVIWCDGQPCFDNQDWIFLSSTWAIPELAIGNDVYPCFVFTEDFPQWHAHTFWPSSAREIIGAQPALPAPQLSLGLQP